MGTVGTSAHGSIADTAQADARGTGRLRGPRRRWDAHEAARRGPRPPGRQPHARAGHQAGTGHWPHASPSGRLRQRPLATGSEHQPGTHQAPAGSSTAPPKVTPSGEPVQALSPCRDGAVPGQRWPMGHWPNPFRKFFKSHDSPCTGAWIYQHASHPRDRHRPSLPRSAAVAFVVGDVLAPCRPRGPELATRMDQHRRRVRAKPGRWSFQGGCSTPGGTGLRHPWAGQSVRYVLRGLFPAAQRRPPLSCGGP